MSTWLFTPTLLYLLFTYIRMNFMQIRSFATKKDFFAHHSITTQPNASHLYSYILSFILCTYIMLTLSLQLDSIKTIFQQITFLPFVEVFTVFLLVSMRIVFSLNFAKQKNINWAPLMLILTFTSLHIYSTGNLLQFYLLLEVMAYITLLFLSLSLGGEGSKTVTTALIISFVLNFLSSILFFTFLLYFSWNYGYPTWDSLYMWTPSSTACMLLLIAILVKVGIGPWLSGNILNYMGFSLNYLIIYTISFLLTIVPVLLSLFYYVNIPLITLLLLVLVITYINLTSLSVVSLKSLFAYSTVILFIYLISISTL